MLLPGSFPAALAMMLGSMLCWGSWTNTYRLTRKWRLEFFHVDYAMGVFLAASIAALTGGMVFASPDFLDNLRAADGAALLCAAAGGVSLSIGNFLLMAGIARVGMTVAFPVSVGFALVVSTVLSYAIRPLGDPVLLGAGVALVVCAVVTNSLAYRSAAGAGKGGGRGGLGMCFAAGVLFSISGPLVAKALAPPRPVSSYGAALLYGAGCLAAVVPLLMYLSRRPLAGLPLLRKDYAAGSVRDHAAGVAGGIVWGAGMVLNFLAAGFAGMAVAGAVGQANPLVAAMWGVFIWGEFRGAAGRTVGLLVLMIGLYAAGLVLLGFSFRGA